MNTVPPQSVNRPLTATARLTLIPGPPMRVFHISHTYFFHFELHRTQ
uniref:Uncharacterized protein n=1 Tax=Rubinisphaera brasiliensis (strain ATCC 49424 / DSM 5305 / JCM 21570 / IAM 15109 / NBRC 103401 / IFAM 1448) TaxID=756272 RepID=F0SI41_RUBBR|nr:hypothetical protein Plabr_4169 [Rubinisphaera brasiliensis DSM 5305]